MTCYVGLHDEALVMLTLAYFSDVAQTIVPSVKTDKLKNVVQNLSKAGYPLKYKRNIRVTRYQKFLD